MNKRLMITLILIFVSLATPAPSQAANDAVVHAVLFYSPNCGHCHVVITETLPPLFEKYGDQLSIAGVDVSQPGGQQIFRDALQHFGIESGGVPLLVVGDIFLVGSVDIPERFPGLIEEYLAQGGVDWPAIPSLREAMEASSAAEGESAATQEEAAPTDAQATATELAATLETPEETPEASPTPGLIISGDPLDPSGPKFSRDPLGNSLSVIVLIAMLVSFVAGGISFFKTGLPEKQNTKSRTVGQSKTFSKWLFPALALIGLGVAGYLAFVETAQVEAVCGPVGDCNAVQQSEFALIFGFLPVGVLGVIGYVFILIAWGVERFARPGMTDLASLAILGMTTFGILFSIYLTFLEPFVIGATCAWCLTSAVVMTALFWLSLTPGRLSFFRLK